MRIVNTLTVLVSTVANDKTTLWNAGYGYCIFLKMTKVCLYWRKINFKCRLNFFNLRHQRHVRFCLNSRISTDKISECSPNFEDGRIGLKVAAILFLVLTLFSTPLRPTYYYQRLQTTLLVLAQRCQIERIGVCDSHCTNVSSLFCITP